MTFAYSLAYLIVGAIAVYGVHLAYEYIYHKYIFIKASTLKSYSKKYAKIFYKTCPVRQGKTVVTKETYDNAIKAIYKAGIKKDIIVNCAYYNDLYYAYMDFESLSAFCRLERNDFLGYSVYEHGDECFVVTFRKQTN